MSKLNLHDFENVILEKGLKIFSPRDISLFLNVNRRAARGFLNYNEKKGAIVKLKRGFYAIKRGLPSDFFIANKIYEPSYISLHTALSFHQLIPETVYSVTSVTPKATREFEIMGRSFSYTRIKQEAFTGYEPYKILDETVLIANPEKSTVDFLYLVSRGRFSYNDRLKIDKLDKKELRKMANLFENQKLLRLLKKVLGGNHDQ